MRVSPADSRDRSTLYGGAAKLIVSASSTRSRKGLAFSPRLIPRLSILTPEVGPIALGIVGEQAALAVELSLAEAPQARELELELARVLVYRFGDLEILPARPRDRRGEGGIAEGQGLHSDGEGREEDDGPLPRRRAAASEEEQRARGEDEERQGQGGEGRAVRGSRAR